MSAAPETFIPKLRPMLDGDVAQVIALENLIYPFGWTEAIFRDCIRVGYACWVWESRGAVVGYGIMSMGAGEAHILNIAVEPGLRRRGLGRGMMEHLTAIAQRHQVEAMYLEVRPSNEMAMKLYRQVGFEEIGVRPEYYPGHKGREDALIMARQLC